MFDKLKAKIKEAPAKTAKIVGTVVGVTVGLVVAGLYILRDEELPEGPPEAQPELEGFFDGPETRID